LIGVGAFSDWFKWAKGEETSDHHESDPSLPGWAKYYNLSLDHKVIGIQYGVTSILTLGMAGTFAMIFRTELAAAKLQYIDLGTFNSLIGLHGIVMIAAILLGIGAMSNYFRWLRYRLDSLSALECARSPGDADVLSRGVCHRPIVYPGITEYYCHHDQNARFGNELFPNAHICLGSGSNIHYRADRHAVHRPFLPNGHVPTPVWDGFL